MRVYTLLVETGGQETARVAVSALNRWFDDNEVPKRGTEIDPYGIVSAHFVGHSHPWAEFCATIAIRECGLTNFPAELRRGIQVLRTQKGI